MTRVKVVHLYIYIISQQVNELLVVEPDCQAPWDPAKHDKGMGMATEFQTKTHQ